MPLTKKGKKVKKEFEKEYGKKGEQVFYATENKRKMKGLVKKGKKEMNELDMELNMPNTIGSMFYVLFDDETWTWDGLAKILVERFSQEDIEGLINCLKMEVEENGI